MTPGIVLLVYAYEQKQNIIYMNNLSILIICFHKIKNICFYISTRSYLDTRYCSKIMAWNWTRKAPITVLSLSNWHRNELNIQKSFVTFLSIYLGWIKFYIETRFVIKRLVKLEILVKWMTCYNMLTWGCDDSEKGHFAIPSFPEITAIHFLAICQHWFS